MFKLILQLHGGGKGSTTQVQSYKPTAEEIRMQKMAADYAEATAPNALALNNTAADLLWDSIGSNQVDFNSLNNAAQNQINASNAGMAGMIGANNVATANANSAVGRYAPQYMTAANTTNNALASYSPQYQNAANATNAQLVGLANGVIPEQYQTNMENAIASTLKNTMGNTLTNLGSRGVLNSSVTNTAMNDISKNAADTVAQQYQQNINQIGNLAQQQLGNTNTALGAQTELAQQQLGNNQMGLDAQLNAAQQAYANSMGANEVNSGLFGNLLNSATAGITAGAAAQEAAQQPALNLWNASVGLNQGGTGTALAGVSGKGTTTSTVSNNGGGLGNTLGGVFGGLASGWASTWCFAEDTLVKMADGTEKKIRFVVPGDVVICPHKDGTETEETVTAVMTPHHAEVYIVVAKDRDGKEHHCYTTMTQPLLGEDGKFAQVKNIGIGKELYGGWQVISVIHSGERKVYDLKVSGENNYYADGFVAKGGTTEW